MNTPVQSSEVKTKNITSGLVFGLLFGIIFAIMGLTNLASHTASGILFLIIALLALPPVNKLLKERAHVSLSKGLRIFTIFVLMVVGFSLVGSDAVKEVETKTFADTSTPVSAPAPKPAIKVTAYNLSEAYKANEVAADAKYKGNLVEVSGTIDTIGKDILDTPYVTLKTGEYSFLSIQCMFGKNNLAELADLSKGQSVTLRGEVSGKLVNVLVGGCSIVR